MSARQSLRRGALLAFAFPSISVWVEARYPLRGYARLVGAPNGAPSLRSVAGLLHMLALESRYEDTAPLPHRSVTTRAWTARLGVRLARVSSVAAARTLLTRSD